MGQDGITSAEDSEPSSHGHQKETPLPAAHVKGEGPSAGGFWKCNEYVYEFQENH